MTMASGEEPPYLTIGTDVSAKYKGAFCEAKITDVNKHVKLKVSFEGGGGNYLIDDTELKAGSILETGGRIEARHPEKRKQTYLLATITKILDHSRYTVVFDDGDKCVLRRNSLCLKGAKHFAESETLDQLPLTKPEHFGNPVKVGVIEQMNNSSNLNNSSTGSNRGAQNNHYQSRADRPRGKSSTNSSSTTSSEDTKSNITSRETNNNRKRNQPDYNNETTSGRKTKKSRITPSNETPEVVSGSRRGVRRRRDSTNEINYSELNNDLKADSPEPIDASPKETNIDYAALKIGDKLMVQYGKGKVQNVYEAKINKIETNTAGKTRYFVHYTGWNNRYDEWITQNRILSTVTEKENGSRDGRTKQAAEPVATTTATSSTTTSTLSSSTASTLASSTSVASTTSTSSFSSTASSTSSTSISTSISSVSNSTSKSTPTLATTSSTQTTATTTQSTLLSKIKQNPGALSALDSLATSPVSKPNTKSSRSKAATPASAKKQAQASKQTVSDEDLESRGGCASLTKGCELATPVVPNRIEKLEPPVTKAAKTERSNSVTSPATKTTATTTTSNGTTSKPKSPSISTIVLKQEPPQTVSNSTITTPKSKQTMPQAQALASETKPVPTLTPVTSSPPASTSSTSSASSTSSSSSSSSTSSASSSPPSTSNASVTTLALKPTTTTTTTTNTTVESESATGNAVSAKNSSKKNNTKITSTMESEKRTRLIHRFCEAIDESDCDKKISILQERIMALRQTYLSLKSEFNDLDRRRGGTTRATA